MQEEETLFLSCIFLRSEDILSFKRILAIMIPYYSSVQRNCNSLYTPLGKSKGKVKKEGEQMRLLIAEDEEDLAEALTVFFEKNQFCVDTVKDGFSAYEYGISGAYDGIILDIMMPKLSGMEVLGRLRAEGIKTPIMMLTAMGQKEDRIAGFDAGADDYLPKPFEPDELLSRVRAMLRRGTDYKPTILSYDDLTLDAGTGMLDCKGKSLRLTGREFQVMELLMRSPKIVFSAEHMIERIWGWDSETQANVIWVHISNLRRKLKVIGSEVSIYANRGLGYVLEARPEQK